MLNLYKKYPILTKKNLINKIIFISEQNKVLKFNKYKILKVKFFKFKFFKFITSEL